MNPLIPALGGALLVGGILSLVAGVRPAPVPAALVAICVKGPALAVARSILKPTSALELSVQVNCSLFQFVEPATAAIVRPVGA